MVRCKMDFILCASSKRINEMERGNMTKSSLSLKKHDNHKKLAVFILQIARI